MEREHEKMRLTADDRPICSATVTARRQAGRGRRACRPSYTCLSRRSIRSARESLSLRAQAIMMRRVGAGSAAVMMVTIGKQGAASNIDWKYNASGSPLAARGPRRTPTWLSEATATATQSSTG